MSENSLRSALERLIRDKIEAAARLWYASEPDKGLRERLTEGLITKMAAAVLPALATTQEPQRVEAAAPRPELAPLHAKAQEVARLVTRSDADAATVENTLFTAFVDVATPRPELASAQSRLDEARWWRSQMYSRMHGAFYKDNDPTLADSLEEQRIANLEVAAEREAPPDLAGALERLAAEVELRRQHFHHLYSTFRATEMADETGQTKNGWQIYLAEANAFNEVLHLIAAQLKVQR